MREVAPGVVTHAHPDHFGSSHAVCEAFDVPLWAGAKDVEAIETAKPVPAPGRISALMSRMKMPAPHPVAKGLREGDQVADFTVLDVPGHSPGQIALWRESDRTLVCGDVFFRLLRVSAPWKIMTVDAPAGGTQAEPGAVRARTAAARPRAARPSGRMNRSDWGYP